MPKGTFKGIADTIKNLLVYKEPSPAKQFVLGEGNEISQSVPASEQRHKLLAGQLQYAKLLCGMLEEIKACLAQTNEKNADECLAKLQKVFDLMDAMRLQYFCRTAEEQPVDAAKTAFISPNLADNQKVIEELYFLPANNDVVIRHLDTEVTGGQKTKVMMVFIDSMTDKNDLSLTVMLPLMLLKNLGAQHNDKERLSSLMRDYLPNREVIVSADLSVIVSYINRGYSGLFIDGWTSAALIATEGAKKRAVEKAAVEGSVRGSQAAFNEQLQVNLGLIRSRMPTSDLVSEMVTVGARVPVNCAILYLKSLANTELVGEVKRRIRGVATDYVSDSGMLEEFIEDHPYNPFPQMLSTERPDRVAASLAEGRIAILVDSNPFAYVVPVSLFSFFHAAPDFGVKYQSASFMRFTRLVGTFITVLLPAMYLGINYYHQEALPTELVLAISAARERVPFPAFIEILLMELSFELIREAGLRVPSPLGPAIGIVGAIILGQAAVAANLVSPIMVVIIAITGLASFTITNYQMSFSFRLMRFCFLILAAVMGLVGVAFGLVVLVGILASMKSFGVPYLAPLAPKTFSGADVFIRGPVFDQERRPDEINPQDNVRQPHISRIWRKLKRYK